jgi:hypothetical protein
MRVSSDIALDRLPLPFGIIIKRAAPCVHSARAGHQQIGKRLGRDFAIVGSVITKRNTPAATSLGTYVDFEAALAFCRCIVSGTVAS